jgi:RNA polymerase sigma factor (sigma-70 family)
VRRINFSAVDEVTARNLLRDYAQDLRALVGQYSWLNVADQADLRSAGQLAVLEGHLSFNGNGTARGWILTVVRWRLREAFAATHHPEILAANPERMNGADPEQQFWRATAVRAIGRLSPRHRVIVDGRMRGETFEEIGASIGLSTSAVHRESEKAFSILRAVLDIEEPGIKSDE